VHFAVPERVFRLVVGFGDHERQIGLVEDSRAENLVAGGNAFYEKRSRRKPFPGAPDQQEMLVASADQQTLPGINDNRPVTVASAATDASLASAMSFEASSKQADAIGALIAAQDRPMNE